MILQDRDQRSSPTWLRSSPVQGLFHPNGLDLKALTTAAKSKAAIQKRVEELEQQRVEVIAEMDIQEDCDQETYDRLVVSM